MFSLISALTFFSFYNPVHCEVLERRTYQGIDFEMLGCDNGNNIVRPVGFNQDIYCTDTGQDRRLNVEGIFYFYDVYTCGPVIVYAFKD